MLIDRDRAEIMTLNVTLSSMQASPIKERDSGRKEATSRWMQMSLL